MHIKKLIFFLLILPGLAITENLWAQPADSVKISTLPKLIGTVYSNFHSELGAQNNAFNINRAYMGFQTEKFNFGSEFNYRINDNHQTDYNITGYSFYTKYHFAKRWEAFGRYDILTSNNLQEEDYGWNYSKDGSAIIAGIEFQPIKKVRLSLNYQDWVPYPPNLRSRSFIYLNLEFKI